MDDLKLRLTGGSLDHSPNRQSNITSHRWSIGPSSIWRVKFRKVGRSKLRHLDQEAFLLKAAVVCNMVDESDGKGEGSNCLQNLPLDTRPLACPLAQMEEVDGDDNTFMDEIFHDLRCPDQTVAFIRLLPAGVK